MHVSIVLGGQLLVRPAVLAVERREVDVVLTQGDQGQVQNLPVNGPRGLGRRRGSERRGITLGGRGCCGSRGRPRSNGEKALSPL